MTAGNASIRFSVIVASRGRPGSLRRTLTAIRQLDHPVFEVILVGDSEALEAARSLGADWAKVIAFDRANLSKARNLGIGAAAGDVCAFVDDDAVPEPGWLRHHEAALRSTGAAATVGYVRGPDGIRFQSQAQSIDRAGASRNVPAPSEASFVPELPEGQAVKLIGTNMAVRRKEVAVLGGFDPAYRYYLEDADLSLRLVRAGRVIAVAPRAEVHHALGPSSNRTLRRAPRDLRDIGRSSAIFLRRHGGGAPDDALSGLVEHERNRAIRAMVRGNLEPRDIKRLLGTLRDGWADGLSADLTDLKPLCDAPDTFRDLAPPSPGHHVACVRLPGRAAAMRQARRLTENGDRASVFSFTLTSLPRRVRYTDDGIWLHTGGQFLRPVDSRQEFRWCRFANCCREEIARVAKQRGLNDGGDWLAQGAECRICGGCVKVQ